MQDPEANELPEVDSSSDEFVEETAEWVVVLDPRSDQNEIARAQIPTIDQLSILYKDPDIANRVYSFLRRDDMNISFPLSDILGGLTSGGTVTYGFYYLSTLVKHIDTLTITEIVQDGKWREICMIVNKLRHFGFGGLYLQQLEEEMTAEKERLDDLAAEEAESKLQSEVMLKVSAVLRESAEILKARHLARTEEIAREQQKKTTKKFVD